MAKKKKTQLKPVARGFATTSVPKKASAVEPELEVQTEDASAEDVGGIHDSAGVAQQETEPSEVAIERELQAFVDKHQEKTEKEISRTLKTIESERRLSKPLPEFSLDSVYQRRILELVKLTNVQENPASKVIDNSDDKALVRLGITYAVLRRLGVTEDVVMNCLSAITGVDLDEALDWLHVYGPDKDLSDEHTYTSPQKHHNSNLVSSPLLSPLNKTVVTPSPNSNRSPNFSSEPPSTPNRQSFSTNTPLMGVSDLDIDDPSLDFAHTTLALLSFDANRKSEVDQNEVARLQKRLGSLQSHYFFRQRDADAHLKKLKADAAQKRLELRLLGSNDIAIPDDDKSRAECKAVSVNSIADSDEPDRKQPELSPDIFDQNGGEETDGPGIFGNLLDTMPELEVEADGTEVQLRDMELPRLWSGRTPKTLLQELVQKADRYAVISYSPIPQSPTSRATRCRVLVRWEGAAAEEWSMKNVGCYDDNQAEQFVSTIALHGLTFGHSEAFASEGNGIGGVGPQTYYRLLPPIYRDLWSELEKDRRASYDARNRTVWQSLKEVLRSKLCIEGGNSSSVRKTERSSAQPSPLPSLAPKQFLIDDDVSSRFQQRQESHPYRSMLEQRNKLPIAQFRETILETIENSQVMVLSGETGCGKSTQLPAYILENHLSQGKHCKILCTEPRRISAVSLANRVSLELGDAPGAVGTAASLVGYTIRLESNTTRNTRLIFATNGIALRMLEAGSGHGGSGTAFDDITHVVIDEVHERNLDSDFLLIVLWTLIRHRRDLKVVLMSATLEADKISEYFGGCPVLQVPGRTFPVEVRWLEDAIEATQWSISEESPYAVRQNNKFRRNGKLKDDWQEDQVNLSHEEDGADHQHIQLEKRYSPSTRSTLELLDERTIPYELMLQLLELICFRDASLVQYSAATLIFLPGIAEIRRLHDMLMEHRRFGAQEEFWIFPLHSTLSSENQTAVFDIPPPGVRKIVISTNIAETGVTIPDITCVMDSGKHREMRFDEKRQLSRLVETFIAKSNATQRRGRAGRVQKGICFHLVTQLRHDEMMAEHPLPEMMRLSLSDLALRIKILKVNLGDTIEEVLSRALDPPSSVNVQRAVQVLVEVKALTANEDITPMGRLLSKLPIDVHLGKFLLMSCIFGCIDTALTIAATLNSKSPFVTPFGHEEEADRARLSFQTDNSDFLTIHNAFASWRRVSTNNNGNFVKKFCRQNFLSQQNLQQIEELRQQLLGYLIDAGFIKVSKAYIKDLSRARYSRQRNRIVQVPPELDRNADNPNLLNAALISGLYPKVILIDEVAGQLRTLGNNQQVYFHPSSINFGRKYTEFDAAYLVYFTIMQSKKLYAWETGPIDDAHILLLCGELEVKLPSGALILDRKIKLRASARSAICVKYLREQLASILSLSMRGRVLNELQQRWYSLALEILGHATPVQPTVPQISAMEVNARSAS